MGPYSSLITITNYGVNSAYSGISAHPETSENGGFYFPGFKKGIV